MRKKSSRPATDAKQADLASNTTDGNKQPMTSNQGLKINDDGNSLKAGERGATLLEDFILREKITHFDHERIPERIVHARGSAAHGLFEATADMSAFTKAGFLKKGTSTPVFLRFSTVAGSRGSADLARDIRGFAVKFYTQEGVFDLVGNNTPVFFIQDAMKFPDLIHSVKPEPDNEIPQAASAHDTFYDFISLTTESLHNHMWAMSDRAIPRSLRMMEGFGIHTFRLINDKGQSHFVKFHWKPLLGVHSVTWEEAVKINGADPDFHRRDLWDAIESGNFPQWELGLQIIPEKDEHSFDFDLLDPTKLVPEELVPVTIVGRMTLNRNPDNFFAETEQVAFHPGHIVPGIDFSNDPLLQGRLFSYTDTQLSRLGGPNFHEIPINRPVNRVHNNQRDGHMRMGIDKGKAAYFPNTIGGGCPHLNKMAEGGFHSYEERIDARKVRDRSSSFSDHFSQPALFYRSLQPWEQQHIINAYSFELNKCKIQRIKERMLWLINRIDAGLAKAVSDNLGIAVPKKIDQPVNQNIGADAVVKKYQPGPAVNYLDQSPALSQANTVTGDIATRQVAVLAADGFSMSQYSAMKKMLESKKATTILIAPHGGSIRCDQHMPHPVDAALDTTESVLYDALYIPGGKKSIEALKKEGKAIKFINETLKHCKAIATGEGSMALTGLTYLTEFTNDEAVLINGKPAAFAAAIGKHRNWIREEAAKKIPV